MKKKVIRRRKPAGAWHDITSIIAAFGVYWMWTGEWFGSFVTRHFPSVDEEMLHVILIVATVLVGLGIVLPWIQGTVTEEIITEETVDEDDDEPDRREEE